MATPSRTRNRAGKAAQASATRVRIVAAATELFLRDGFVSTTMAMIAGEAGVAVQTLYQSFGSKTAILQAAFDRALRGTDPVDILESDWFQQVRSEPDGRAALRLHCERSAEVMGRAAPLFEVIRAASADPEVADLLARNKKLRYDGFAIIVDAIAGRDGFNPDLTARDAHGILYGVLSEDAYLLMVHEHGWTHERWVDWVTGCCLEQFFPNTD